MSIGKINMIYYNEKEVRLDKMREALLREPNYEKHDNNCDRRDRCDSQCGVSIDYSG